MKLNLRNKLKNFFTIPDEVFEEEPSPKFEKQTLFTLTKNKLFFGILAFMFLIDILVGFDLNKFYIRATLGFLFLTIVPGLLIMLMMKIREVGFWEYLVYVVGLSISFIMFGGLAVNWILPWLNITDKPLSLWPILLCFNFFLLIFWLVAYIRNQDFKPFTVQLPKLDTLNTIFFIIPVFFPVLAILGAFLLNNHGPNILTMIMLGGIAIYVLLLTIFRKRLDENIWPWALYFMGLALLLMFSMRGNFVNGLDSGLEFKYFLTTFESSLWSTSFSNNAYNFCMSITILPTILIKFMNIDPRYFFKILSPLIFGFFSVIIYQFTRQFFKRKIAFFSSVFFFSWVWFVDPMVNLVRQQYGFMFLALVALISFNNKDYFNKKIFFLLFAASMIISHYSTSYIFLASIIFLCLFQIIFQKTKNTPRQKFYSVRIVFMVLIFGFLWYAQVSTISEGPINFIKDSIENLPEMFNQDMKNEKLNQYFSFGEKRSPGSLLEKYKIERQINEGITNITFKEINNIYPIYLKDPKNIYLKNIYLIKYLNNLFNIYLILIALSFIAGFFYIYKLFIYGKINREYFLIITFYLGMIFFIIVLPGFSKSYNVERLFLQAMIFISPLPFFGLSFLFKKLFKENTLTIIFAILMIFLLLNYGFLFQITLQKPYLWTNNYGNHYDLFYTPAVECHSAGWYSNFTSTESKIVVDGASRNRIRSCAKRDNLKQSMFPYLIKKDYYVYVGYNNLFEQVSYASLNGMPVTHNFPTEFLHENKNKIYNNGGSEIFK